MNPIQVLSLSDLNEAQLAILQAVPGVAVRQAGPGEDILPLLQQAEVMLTSDIDFDLAHAPRLRWIQTVSAGINHLPLSEIERAGIRLTTGSGLHGVPIAEHVFALLLAWTRRLHLAWRYTSTGDWEQAQAHAQYPPELYGSTLGIVGYGSIGRQVARVGAALGMRVLAVRRTEGRQEQGYSEPGVGDPAGEIPERIYRPEQLHEMLPLCDHIVLALPLTPETRGIIGERELAAMKPSAFLVNIARGGLVDEPALIRALQTGTIAGAGLDVFSVEPLPPDSPLYRMPNVLLTPHTAGGSQPHGDRLARLFAENLRCYTEGRPLYNEVEWKRGY